MATPYLTEDNLIFLADKVRRAIHLYD